MFEGYGILIRSTLSHREVNGAHLSYRSHDLLLLDGEKLRAWTFVVVELTNCIYLSLSVLVSRNLLS